MSLRTTHYAHPAALGFVRLSAFRGSLLSAALCRARARRVLFGDPRANRSSIIDHRDETSVLLGNNSHVAICALQHG